MGQVNSGFKYLCNVNDEISSVLKKDWSGPCVHSVSLDLNVPQQSRDCRENLCQ